MPARRRMNTDERRLENDDTRKGGKKGKKKENVVGARLYTRGPLIIDLSENLELVHDRSMSLELNADVSSNTKFLVLPKVTKRDLLSSETKISKAESGALGGAGAVDDDKSIGAIGKRTHPSLDKLAGILGGEAKANALEGVGGGIISPLLVVTTVARIDLNDGTLVVPDVNAEVVHLADEGGVVVIDPLLVEGLSAHGLVADVAGVDTKLNVAGIAAGNLKAHTLSVTDGVVGVESPELVLGTSALLSNNLWVTVTEAVGNLATLDTKRILVDGDDFLVHENLPGVGVLLGHIAADEKRSLGESPEGEVSAVLVSSHTTVTDLEHIRIVPATRTSVVGPLVVLVDDADHALP